MTRRSILLLAITISVAVTIKAQQQPQELLKWGVVGASCENKTTPCYNDVMRSLPAQRLLLDLAHAPLDAAAVENALSGEIKAKDLLHLGLARREGDRYFLNFPLFTAADLRRIIQTSDRYGASLAQAMLARRAEIESALRSYDAPGVDSKAVGFFVLGCASLDWDGLTLTAAKGYRKEAAPKPDGHYLPYAEEKSEVSLARIYRGSHNSAPIFNVHFTSFGDDEAIRYALPDILWRLPAQVSSADYPEDLRRPVRLILARSLDHTAFEMGQMLFALRDRERSSEELGRVAGTDARETETLLNFLVSLDYITEKEARYQLKVPVLTMRDDAMTKRLLAIGNQVMDAWLAANYSKLREELKDLSFTRSRVPFEDGFTMIWHYVFGIANQKLVEGGLFADPYAPGRKYKGSIPAVFEIDFQ